MSRTAFDPDADCIEIPSRAGDPAWELALLFPKQGQWTESDFLALDTSRLVELSEGCLEVLPMSTAFHQFIVLFLLDAFRDYAKLHPPARVLPAPVPVRLWPGKMREPDIVYFHPDRLPNVHGQPNGADLAVEVVSEGPENRDRDLVTKRSDYARAGIAEYWIVDPLERQIIVLTLESHVYREHGVFGSGRTATSLHLPGLTIDVDATFAAGRG
jgi:Uma2 family endonuclease